MKQSGQKPPRWLAFFTGRAFMPRPLPDPTLPLRAAIRTIHQLGDRIRATRAGDGMPIDQAARHCGVSVGMLSKLENGKGVNLEHALRVLDGLV